jgi:predicted  nucleic acid-binding Zn-ribbon protein
VSNVEPIQQLQQDISSVQSVVSSLHSDVRLSSVRDSVEDLHTTVNGLATKVKDLRTRGYAFGKGLEDKAASLAQQWQSLRPTVESQIERQALDLQYAMQPIETLLQQLVVRSGDVAGAQPILTQVRAAVSNMQSKVNAAQSSISGMYDSLQNEVNQFVSSLGEIEWTLGQLAEASFQLLPSEGAIQAVQAVWVQGQKETDQDPRGVLYLTDQRLIFEQKQDIATKRVLFVVTEKKKVQELKLELRVTQVESVTASKRGLLGHEDHLDFAFGSGASVPLAHLHIDGQDCNRWQALVGRAKSGDFDQERAVAVDQAQVEKAKAAPVQCPNCGGQLPPVLRGMDLVKCEFCGRVVRL